MITSVLTVENKIQWFGKIYRGSAAIHLLLRDRVETS